MVGVGVGVSVGVAVGVGVGVAVGVGVGVGVAVGVGVGVGVGAPAINCIFGSVGLYQKWSVIPSLVFSSPFICNHQVSVTISVVDK